MLKHPLTFLAAAAGFLSVVSVYAGLGSTFIFRGTVNGFEKDRVFVQQGAKVYAVPRKWITAKGQLQENQLVEAEIPAAEFKKWRPLTLKATGTLPTPAPQEPDTIVRSR